MGYKHSFRSKAVHFVSDLTTVILNPISDDSSKHHEDENCDKEISLQHQVATEGDVEIQADGPDTSSFTAFMFSLLSSSKPDKHSNEETVDNNAGMDPRVKERTGRKSLISYGKQSLRKAIYQASRISGYRDQGTDKMVDSDAISDEYKLRPLQVPKETLSQLILPDISEPSLLLSENVRKNLYVSLPVLVQERKWILLYSTWRHGISLSTLYRRSMLCPGLSLLVVGDRKGAVFGGLVEAPLRPSNKRKYQGTNNTFVFTNLSNQLVVYRPTGVNRYFTVCSTDFLALGGGSHFALYLDGDLLSGSSSASETFGNSCLAHSQDFEVKEVELWGFVYGSKYEETLALCRREGSGICRW